MPLHLWIPGERQPHVVVDDYSDAEAVRKPDGIIFVDGKEVASTLMCPHCGMHFVARKGSGHKRSFCLPCGAPCCDKSTCHPDPFHGSNQKPIAAEYGILSTREV